MVTLQVAFAAMALSGVSQTVLLDFYSDSCGPCREMNPTVQALINAGYPVQRVNVAKNRALTAKYGISNIPCFVMLVDGREVDRTIGRTSMSRLQEMCQAGRSASRPSRPPPANCHERRATGAADFADAAFVFIATSIVVGSFVRSVGAGLRCSAVSATLERPTSPSALESSHRRLGCHFIGGQCAIAC